MCFSNKVYPNPLQTVHIIIYDHITYETVIIIQSLYIREALRKSPFEMALNHRSRVERSRFRFFVLEVLTYNIREFVYLYNTYFFGFAILVDGDFRTAKHLLTPPPNRSRKTTYDSCSFSKLISLYLL